MNKYLLIKMGGSTLMGNMIVSLLDRMSEGESNAQATVIDGILVVKFDFGMDIGELQDQLNKMSLVNYFLVKRDNQSLRCMLTDKINSYLDLNQISYSKNPEQLKKDLQRALENEDFELASKIRDELNKTDNQ